VWEKLSERMNVTVAVTEEEFREKLSQRRSVG